MRKRDDSATVQLKVRIKEPLRAAIEREASIHDVTMNAEIAATLEHAYLGAGSLRTLFDAVSGGARNAEVVLKIARILRDSTMFAAFNRYPGWLDDDDEFETVKLAITTALERELGHASAGDADKERAERHALVAHMGDAGRRAR